MATIPALAAVALLFAATPAPAQTAVNAAPAKAKPAAAETSTKIELVAEDKRKVAASYWAPKDQKGAAPAAVLVHDAGAQRSDLNDVAERLWKQGFAVISVDLRGHGESQGTDKGWAELSEEEHAKAWAFCLRDVKAAADWIGKQSGVHSSNVSLLGDRAGCTLVTRYAMRDENVRSLVLLDPQVEQLGFSLAKDIASLAGLPTYIAATKESAPKAQTIAESGEKANEGNKFIEIALFKGAPVMPTTDKTLVAGIAKFMGTQANPEKAAKK